MLILCVYVYFVGLWQNALLWPLPAAQSDKCISMLIVACLLSWWLFCIVHSATIFAIHIRNQFVSLISFPCDMFDNCFCAPSGACSTVSINLHSQHSRLCTTLCAWVTNWRFDEMTSAISRICDAGNSIWNRHAHAVTQLNTHTQIYIWRRNCACDRQHFPFNTPEN